MVLERRRNCNNSYLTVRSLKGTVSLSKGKFNATFRSLDSKAGSFRCLLNHEEHDDQGIEIVLASVPKRNLVLSKVSLRSMDHFASSRTDRRYDGNFIASLNNILFWVI